LPNAASGAAPAWETVERLSGTLYAWYNRSLAVYDGFNVWLQNQNTLENNACADAPLEYGLLSHAVGDLCLARSSVRCNLPGYAFSELDPSSITAWVRKQSSGQLTAGVGVAHTDGDAAAIDPRFDRHV